MLELEGQAIEHYHILRRLAHGGMSDIYLAQDTHADRTVVIKMVHNSNREYCERFRSEVQTTSALHHSHILPTLTYGQCDSWFYMVSPYIEAGTLHDRLAQGPLSLEETGAILTQLASALQFAHDHGVIHRDLKPSNILLQERKHVYLADFGLAQHIDKDEGLTITECLIGTPEYMAPELAEEKATIKSDIYALGVILYQLLTGHVPFKGSTPIGTYLKHIRERPVSPAILNPTIPEEIADIILRALEKKPGHRHNSARDLAQAYQRALTEHEHRSHQRETSSSLLALTSISTSQLILARKKTLRGSLPVLIAVLCFALLPGVLGFASYYFNGSQPAISRNGVATPLQKIERPAPQRRGITTIDTAPPTTHGLTRAPVASSLNDISSLLQQFQRDTSGDRDEKNGESKNYHNKKHE